MDMKNRFPCSSMISKRRSNKPIVEKRRRERINRSLEELKKLVLQSLHKDTEEFEKMEKADILEMAVNHLKNLKKRQSSHLDMRTTSRTESLGNYRTGYNECATEVMRYLSHTTAAPHNNPSVKNRLLDHVSSCVQRVNNTLAPAVPPRVAPTSTYTPSAAAATGSCHTLSLPSSTPHASLPGSSGNLSSFRPVRKSPTEAFEAPKCDYSASSVNCSLPSPPNAACFSPVDFHLNFLSSFPVQSPSSSQYSSSSESRSVTPTHSADNGSAPAYLAAMDIEEIRAKYGNVWRPW